MSRDNLERLRVAYANFASDGSLPFGLMADDIELKQPDEIGGGEGTYRGRDGVARAVHELLEFLDEFEAVPEEFIEAGDYVVVLVRLRGRARGSGVPVDGAFAHVWRFRGDKADLWHAYPDRREALKAVGLRE